MKEYYLDNASTTPIDNLVVEEINKFAKEYYANPSSLYSISRIVRERIEKIRENIAKKINCESEEIIFTSGATESNNFIFKGLAKANPEKKHIILSNIEHPSIIKTCEILKGEGYEIDYIRVNSEGLVDIEKIAKKIRKDTLLVSIMHVNNEIGTIQPIEDIGRICRDREVYFHTDAVQSFCKLDIDVKKMNIDLMSLSGHKINGPKGIGLAYVRLGTRIKPLITGGSQEFKLRAGTENTLGIIGFGKAVEIKRDIEGIKRSRDKLLEKIKEIDRVRINGSIENRIYNNINVSFYGIEGESLLIFLEEEGIFVSTGSACASAELERSHVLKAINIEDLYIQGTIRISLGNVLSEEEIDFIVNKIKEGVEKLRRLSPFK